MSRARREPSRTWQLPSSIGLRELALALPSGLGHLASDGQWRTAPHLNLLTKRLVDLEQRRITRLMVEMPPRHGKSELCSHYFPAWYLGRHPTHRVLLASYEGGFASMWGEQARLCLIEHGDVFGVHVRGGLRSAKGNWRLEEGGGMMCSGVSGGFTGRGADLLIIDDPVRNAEEALSMTYRQRAWDWYTSTARTRLEPGGIVVLVMTRWHLDDLAGRILTHQQATGTTERWDELYLPAFAQGGDELGREEGAALWPWRYDVRALKELRDSMTQHWWNALYQQRPTPPGGSLAKAIWFAIVYALPENLPTRRCRFWDCAGSVRVRGSDPDYTVGALVSRIGPWFYIENIVRVQMSSGDVDQLIQQTAALDGPGVLIREEQEGGSAGLAVINARRLALAGFDYRGIPARGSKELKWQPMLVQAEAGNVKMLKGDWNAAWLEEVVAAPYGAHDDQLDAVSGSFNTITQEKQPYTSATW